MKNRLILFATACVLLIASSCGDKQLRGFKKAESGIYYKFHIQHDKDCDKKAEKGDVIDFGVRVYLQDTVLQDAMDVNPIENFYIDTARFMGDIFYGLTMMCEGDSATFVIQGDSLKKYYEPYQMLDSNIYVFFDIKIKRIKKHDEILADLEQLRQEENIKLNTYIKQQNIDFPPALNGIYFIEEKAGRGEKPEYGHIVSMELLITNIEGDTVMYYPEDDPLHYIVGTAEFPIDWSAQITDMKRGGKATLIVPSEAAFGEIGSKYYGIKPYQTLIVYIHNILAIHSDRSTFEDAMIVDFLKRQKAIKGPVGDGLYMLDYRKGDGKAIKSGDAVNIDFYSYFIDGTPLANSQQQGKILVEVGKIDTTYQIRGWHEALKMMHYGDTASFLFHSNLAYGAEGNAMYVAPYSPIICTIIAYKPE